MRIWIITMEDPLYTIGFFKEIIDAKHHNIVGITIAKGDRLKIGKKKSKTTYLFSLMLIMGLPSFIKNVCITSLFKLRRKLAKHLWYITDPGLVSYASKYNIPVDLTDNPNSKDFLSKLREYNIDIIINQSQFIIKKELLSIPKLGVLNRHNALLPRNRGRLTPFWVLFHQEKETGISIHFVDEGIDSGKIVVQEKFNIAKGETFSSLVKKNYSIAAKAMVKAINKIELQSNDFLPNPDELATYNTIPTLMEAWEYRKRNLIRFFFE